MALAELAAQPRNEKAVKAAIAALAAKFGNRLVTSQAVREQHGNILTWIENQPPDAVVFPQSAEDVQDAVRICAQHKVPVIPSAPAPRSKATSTRRRAASRSTSAT